MEMKGLRIRKFDQKTKIDKRLNFNNGFVCGFLIGVVFSIIILAIF